MSGGESKNRRAIRSDAKSYPHERGCFRTTFFFGFDNKILPAIARVYLIHEVSKLDFSYVTRMSGGVSRRGL